MNIEDMKKRLEELAGENEILTAKATAEKRDFTEAEEKQFDLNQSEFDRVTRNIERLSRQQDQASLLKSGTGRKTEPDDVREHAGDVEHSEQKNLSATGDVPQRRTRIDYKAQPGNGGFRTLGEFAQCARLAARPGGGYLDPRLERLAAPTTVANEGSGGEGGFIVPTDFRAAIMEKVMGEKSLLSRTNQVITTGNSITIPRDNGTPWGGTGIQAYWGNEGGLKTQSRPAFDTMAMRLNKVYALVPVTDELSEDAPALDNYIRRRAPEAIDFKINLAIVQGSGSTQPLGILNSPALITVNKESSQLADTIVASNIVKMWSRMYEQNRQNAVWLVNQDIETQLYTMSMPGKDNTGAFVSGWGSHNLQFFPAGFNGNTYATMFGRPIIPTQACEQLGDKGDIILADLSAYTTAIKSGVNPKTDVSIHLWFDYDVTAYRFVLRLTGQPTWEAPITPREGSNTLSAFVALEDRA